MQRTHSLEQISDSPPKSNAGSHCTRQHPSPRNHRKIKPKTALSNICGHYCIIVKPKPHKSNSLSDLTSYCNDISECSYLDIYRSHKNSHTLEDFFDNNSGDTNSIVHHKHYKDTCLYMSWNLKTKKAKKKSNVATVDYHYAKGRNKMSEDGLLESNMSSCVESSSLYSMEQQPSNQKAAFPFKPTPSGNLKVQSNQVVFQSSTVGVLLADPTQAKVKVKFEGKGVSDLETDEDRNYYHRNYEVNSVKLEHHAPKEARKRNKKSSSVREDKGKDLNSLGYALSEPVDWMRVQLPKKQDLYQEFTRRIHNHINTDTIIQIDDEEFHCHNMVLQIYSSYFEGHPGRIIELPHNCGVTPKSFRIIYEWMISNGNDGQKLLTRNNILDVFCGAQFLAVKDLEEQCWSFILSENLFAEDSAYALFREARLKGLTPVMELMIPRIMRFFLPLVASTDFLELELEEVLMLLRSNYICVSSETEVLMAAVRWLYGDWNERKTYTVDVMQCVRFGLITPWQLVDIKRNPDNGEIVEIVNAPEIQQMVDDGLAYVIIKYWYGNNSQNYHHWINVLGLIEPVERNWLGEEKNHVTYKDFLKYLEQFVMPKEKMYQHMSMLQQTKRSEEVPGSFRYTDNEKADMHRPKMDFQLPALLKGLTGDKDKLPNFTEFFDRVKANDENRPMGSKSPSPPYKDNTKNNRRKSPPQGYKKHTYAVENHKLPTKSTENQLRKSTLTEEFDVKEENNSVVTSDSSPTSDVQTDKELFNRKNGRRISIAASYLAAATASGSKSAGPSSPVEEISNQLKESTNQKNTTQKAPDVFTPQISLFNQSKESLARINLNKLSFSILGPSNKTYVGEVSLFNWDRETVLVFGGTDPHSPYGIGKNFGKDIFRFDPITNAWDYVGDLPEPRHHHAVAFLKGRVYLVGGADPRDDDIRGKSVVVSTVWSYDPVKRAWYSESGIAIPRKNFGLVVHRMALYAIGGEDKSGRVLRSVERFDPKSGTWSEVSPMSVARAGVATTKYREYIWVAGGMTGERRKPLSRVVECYNSKTNEWTVIHSLRFPRCFASLFAMNDKLFLIGGAGKLSEKEKATTSLNSIDVWDWKDRKWKQFTEMSIPRHGHALAYLGTQLIIIGGVTTIYMRALSNVESYCCERGAWIRGVASLPTLLSGHGAVTLPPASLM